MLRCPREARASKHPSFLLYLWPRPSRPGIARHLRVRGDLSMSKSPSFAAGRDCSLRVGSFLSSGLTRGSDEAPEATCLRNLCGSFRRLVRRFFPLHASLWQGGDGPLSSSGVTRGPRMTGRGSGCGITTRVTRQPGRWPGRFPPDGAPFRPGPSPGGCGLRSFATSALIPAVFCRPAVW